MRIHKAMTAAVFGIATAFLVAPAAMATEDYYAAIGIQDREIKAGQEVRIMASCQDPKFTSSKVTAARLVVPGDLRRTGSAPDSVLATMAHVKPDTKPGSYSLSFICNGKKVVGEFEVLPDKKKPAGQVKVKPKGAADTGGGLN